MRLITKFLKFFTCKFLYRVEVRNEEILDKYDSYLICPNHSCVFDPAFVIPTKYEKDIYVIAKKELFNHASFRFLAKRYNAFPIDRENTDVRSILKSLNVFKENDKAKLLLFPEGKVLKTEDEIGNVFKKGAAFIAAHVEKPIIPVHITRRPRFFGKVIVSFGEPFTITKEDIKGMGNIEKMSKMIIDNIYKITI